MAQLSELESPVEAPDAEVEAPKLSPFDSRKEAHRDPDAMSAVMKADDELEALPLLKSPMFTRAPFILITEVCERMAYYGIGANIVTYLTAELNSSTSSAASLVSIWSGTCYLTPLLGAWIADSYIGRFHTIWSFSCVYLAGLVLLTLSAGLPALKPQAGTPATSGQLAAFWVAMYAIALGTGGIKPCVSAFGADQFDDRDPRQKKMVGQYYNWFYAAINVGAILAFTVVVNVQTSVSWVAGFAIPAGSFALAMVVFLAGMRMYRRIPPGGSPYARMYKVLGGAIAHRKAAIPEDEDELHEVPGEESCIVGQMKIARTHSMKPLERAAVAVKPAGTPDRWLATLTEVEELKCLVRLLPIMCTLIVYNCVYAQMTTLFVLQGGGMDTQLGSLHVSPATVNLLDSFSVIIWVVIYDLGIAPYFERRGKPISLLWRIGIGYMVAVAAMTAAAVVDIFRMQSVSDNNLSDLDPRTDPAGVPPISVWWQIPQYFLVGMSEVFAMVGSLQLFYQQAPDAMRSTCAALQLLATGLGSYLAAALVAIIQAITAQNGSPGWIANNINDAHLSYFFWTLAILQALTLVVYVFIAARFRYRPPVHLTVDTQALALMPEGRGGLAFSVSVTREMSKDLHAGMVKLDSVRSGAISTGYSQYRSQSMTLTQSQTAKAAEV